MSGRRAHVAPGSSEGDAEIGHAVLELRALTAVFRVVLSSREVS